jgi:hypothetical protein
MLAPADDGAQSEGCTVFADQTWLRLTQWPMLSPNSRGLTICRSFVERHDGRIGVAPVEAVGNRF